MEAGRYGEAKRLLRGDASSEARFALGYALAFQGRYGEAEALYRALFRETKSHRALHQVGMVLRMAGRIEEALEVFREEARLLPEESLAWAANRYEQGLAHLLLGRREESRALLEEALAWAEGAAHPLAQAVAHRGLLLWHLRFGSREEVANSCPPATLSLPHAKPRSQIPPSPTAPCPHPAKGLNPYNAPQEAQS